MTRLRAISPAGLARLALCLVLLVIAGDALVRLPALGSLAPILRLWPDAEAQNRLQMDQVPYDLLRAADAALPRHAGVVLVTAGTDVRHREYTTFHRALYLLAPRSVWWLTPAANDGTWEARWWVSAPLSADNVLHLAAARGAAYVLVDGDLALAPVGSKTALPGGYLLALGDAGVVAGAPSLVAVSDNLWPARLALACAIVWMLGAGVMMAAIRLAYQPRLLEAVVLPWVLGAVFLTLAMLLLNALGFSLNGQARVLAVAAGISLIWVWRNRSRLPRPTGGLRGGHVAMTALSGAALVVLGLTTLYVVISVAGRPLYVWDSWVTWGMKARLIFLEGGISPAVYGDASRTVTHLDYPLLWPLLGAWLYQWLAAPDDRLLGIAVVGFYVALAGVAYTAFRRCGAQRSWALAGAAAIACLPGVAGTFAGGFADAPLVVLAAITAVFLAEWLRWGRPGDLLVAVVAGGALPWTKREGLILVAALCLAVLIAGKGTRRGVIGAGCLVLATLLISGPWWAFVIWHGIANTDFLPITLATLAANLHRLPTMAYMELRNLMSLSWALVWPLAALLVAHQWAARARDGSSVAPGAYVLPVTAVLYIGACGLSYVFSAFVPYQQHVASSFSRLLAQVAALPVLWLVWLSLDAEPGC